MEKMQIIESESYPGFYKIKYYGKYLVSKEGLVLNIIKNVCLKGSVNPDGYNNFRLTRNDGYCYTWGLHRLLCYVFKSEDGFDPELTVNHIDGIKSNNSLDNLEWCSYQQQAEHAGSIGLTIKCQPITVKDLKSNEVIEFPSLIECARYYKVSKDFINYRIKRNDERLWPEMRQYRSSFITGPWKDYSFVQEELIKDNVGKVIQVKFLLNNLVKVYDSLKSAAFDLNISISTLSTWLKNKNQHVYPGLIQIKFYLDKTPWRLINDPYLELMKSTNCKVVKIINSENMETLVFESAAKCAEYLNISQTCLNYRLKSNFKTVFSDKFTYGYHNP